MSDSFQTSPFPSFISTQVASPFSPLSTSVTADVSARRDSMRSYIAEKLLAIYVVLPGSLTSTFPFLPTEIGRQLDTLEAAAFNSYSSYDAYANGLIASIAVLEARPLESLPDSRISAVIHGPLQNLVNSIDALALAPRAQTQTSQANVSNRSTTPSGSPFTQAGNQRDASTPFGDSHYPPFAPPPLTPDAPGLTNASPFTPAVALNRPGGGFSVSFEDHASSFTTTPPSASPQAPPQAQQAPHLRGNNTPAERIQSGRVIHSMAALRAEQVASDARRAANRPLSRNARNRFAPTPGRRESTEEVFLRARVNDYDGEPRANAVESHRAARRTGSTEASRVGNMARGYENYLREMTHGATANGVATLAAGCDYTADAAIQKLELKIEGSAPMFMSKDYVFGGCKWKVTAQLESACPDLKVGHRTYGVFLECVGSRMRGAAQGSKASSSWIFGEATFTVTVAGGGAESEREFCHTFEGKGNESTDWGGWGFEVGPGDASVNVNVKSVQSLISTQKTVMAVTREDCACTCTICQDAKVTYAVLPCGSSGLLLFGPSIFLR